MRYLCVHCNHRFDHDDEAEPRCPQCMRRGGLEKLSRPEDHGPKRSWVPLALAGGLVLLGTAGYFVWASPGTPADASSALRPLSLEELREQVRETGARVPDRYLRLLSVDAAASQAAPSLSRAAESKDPESLVQAFDQRRDAEAYVVWPTHLPRDTTLHSPEETGRRLARPASRDRLYSLEVAAFAVALLREHEVEAMVAEVHGFKDDPRPPDPSGRLGYYGVAIPQTEDAEAARDYRVIDVYGGRQVADPPEGMRVLRDPQAVAAAMNHVAAHRLAEGDATAAFDASTAALSLDPRSAAVRTTRGAVLMTSGGPEEGAREFEAAAQIRPDAPRRNNLAGLALAQAPPDLGRATREVAAALAASQEYGAAHATQAAIHLAEGDLSRAQEALAQVEKLDPDLPTLPMIWAKYYLEKSEPARAAAKARDAVERQPKNWQVRFGAAQVFRAAGDVNAMREAARQTLELVADSRRQEVETLIAQALGPEALGGPDGASDESGASPSLGAFQLRNPASGGGGGGGPSLLGKSLSGSEAPADPGAEGSDMPKLRLGGGQKLRLDLSE